MKHKFYSPFFLVVIAVLFLSCNKRTSVPAFQRPADYNKDIKSADSLMRVAEDYNKSGIYDSAYFYYNKSEQLFAEHLDSLRTGYVLTKMAEIQLNSADYTGCDITATEALVFLKNNTLENNTFKYKEEAYNLLGRCYRKLENYEFALKYYNKALEITKDSIAKSVLLNNMASIYSDNKNYHKAIGILEKLNKSDDIAKDKSIKARILNNLGELYLILNKPEAESYINRGYAIRKEINDRHGILSSYLQLCQLYSQTNKALSKAYAIKAYNLATTINSSDQRVNALEKLMVRTAGAENLQVTNRYLKLSDSLRKVRMAAKNEFAKIKYDSKEVQDNLKKQEIKNQRDEEEHRFKVRVIVLGSVAVLLFVLVFFYIKRLKYRKERLLEAYITETRISKKIHDELANDMFEAMVYAETQDFSQADQKQKLVKNLDSIYNKTRDISRESNNIDTGDNFSAVLKDMLSDYKTEDTNILFIKYDKVDWHSVSEPKKIAVYRVLQELMVNMKKHSGASVTVLRFNADGKKITIQYNDNGKGMEPDKIFYKNGLQNAETRMKSVNGSITFDNEPEKGFRALIEFTL